MEVIFSGESRKLRKAWTKINKLLLKTALKMNFLVVRIVKFLLIKKQQPKNSTITLQMLLQDYLKNPNEHSFFLKEATPYEIATSLQKS